MLVAPTSSDPRLRRRPRPRPAGRAARPPGSARARSGRPAPDPQRDQGRADVRDDRRAPRTMTRAPARSTAVTPSIRASGPAASAGASGMLNRIVAVPACRSTRSAGAPASSTRPPRIATHPAAQASASSISCVTSSTVVPSSCSWRTAAHTFRRAAGSRPWVSSSRMTSRGRFSSARTRNSRCRSPPLSERTPTAARCASPNCSSSSPPSRARRGAEQRDRLGHPQPVRQRRILQLAADQRAQVRGLRDRVVAEHPQDPGVRLAQPLDAFDGRGLPGAVGADQPHDFSGGDVEVQTVHHHSVPVRLA